MEKPIDRAIAALNSIELPTEHEMADHRMRVEAEAWEVYQDRVDYGEITEEEALLLYGGWLKRYKRNDPAYLAGSQPVIGEG